MKNIANLFVLLILLLTNSIYAQVLELTHKQHGNHLYFNQGDKVILDHIEKKDLKGKIMFFEDRLFIYPLLGKNNTETPLMHMRFDSIRMKDIREHGIQVDNISYDKTEFVVIGDSMIVPITQMISINELNAISFSEVSAKRLVSGTVLTALGAASFLGSIIALSNLTNQDGWETNQGAAIPFFILAATITTVGICLLQPKKFRQNHWNFEIKPQP